MQYSRNLNFGKAHSAKRGLGQRGYRKLILGRAQFRAQESTFARLTKVDLPKSSVPCAGIQLYESLHLGKDFCRAWKVRS